MKTKILSIVFLLSITYCFGQVADKNANLDFCKALADYRDNDLFQDLEKISKDYDLNYEQKIYIDTIKKDLLDENKWQMSNAGNAFAQILVEIKGICNLILKTIPASKSAKTTLEAYKVYKLYKYGNEAKDFIDKDFEQYVFDKGVKKILGELNPIKTIIDQTLKTSAEFEKTNNDWKEYKNTITQQISMLDESIKKYDIKIKQGLITFEMKNDSKIIIDNYLRNYCSIKNNTTDRNNRSGIISSNNTTENKQNNRSGIFGTTPKSATECTAK